MLEKLRQLWSHAAWADREILKVVSAAEGEIRRELAHVIGAEEVWLARIEGRSPRAPVWPELPFDELVQLLEDTHERYANYFAGLAVSDLSTSVSYTNSAGVSFETPLADILLHVALHGQYHRGKINLMLRERGLQPAPTDYIAFVRGVPAATEADSASDR